MTDPKLPATTYSIPRDTVKLIAMDIGKEVAADVERMYPEAVAAASSTLLLSLRNCVHNEIMAALETTEEEAIHARIARRKQDRDGLRRIYRRIRHEDTSAPTPAEEGGPPPASAMVLVPRVATRAMFMAGGDVEASGRRPGARRVRVGDEAAAAAWGRMVAVATGRQHGGRDAS